MVGAVVVYTALNRPLYGVSVDVVIADISETSPRHAQTSGVDICRNRMHRLRAHGVVAKQMDVDWSVTQG